MVDGRVITKSEVRDFIIYERLRLAHLYRDDPRKADPEMKKLEAQATDLLVQRLASISDYFRYVKDAELNKLIDQEVKAILGTNEKAVTTTLARGGLTMEKFRWLAKASVIARALDDYRVGRLTTDAFKAIDWPAKKVFISAKVVDVTSADADFWLNFMSSTLATETAKPGDKREESPKAENRAPGLVPAGPDGETGDPGTWDHVNLGRLHRSPVPSRHPRVESDERRELVVDAERHGEVRSSR